MKRRAERAAVLERFIERRKRSQRQAGKLLGVGQPRVNDLLRGRLHRFSIDSLLAMIDRAQIHIEFKVKFLQALYSKAMNGQCDESDQIRVCRRASSIDAGEHVRNRQ